jgi:hypothetical protein
MPVEKRRFQDIRIDIMILKCTAVSFIESKVPTKISTFSALFHMVKSININVDSQIHLYERTTCTVRPPKGIGPIYCVPLFVQRGYWVRFLSGLFRMVSPVVVCGVKAVWRETLRTSGKILTDIADDTSPDLKPSEIVADESANPRRM